MRRSVLAMALAISAVYSIYVPAGRTRAAASTITPVSMTLTNGIRVAAVYFPESTNVSILTFLPLGLASDGPKQAQWSHLVEHLVIRSTIPENDYATANAETSAEGMRLDYYGTKDTWTQGLSHIKRWLQGVPFTEANLDREKPNVKAECFTTAANLATHKFAMAAWGQAFRYGETNAALLGDIDRVSLTQIQKYRDDHLVVLSNVLVCVVGGVAPSQVFPKVTAALGSIRSSARTAPPVTLHPGNREITWDLQARHLLITWPIPDVNDGDFASLMAAGFLLNAQCYSDPELKKLAGMVFAGTDLMTPEGNFFYVTASLRSGASFQQLRQKLERKVQSLSLGDSDFSLLPMIAGNLEQSLTTIPDPDPIKAQLPSSQDAKMVEANLGLQWGMQEFRYGAAKAGLVRRLKELKAESVQRVSKKYLQPSASSVIAIRDSAQPRDQTQKK